MPPLKRCAFLTLENRDGFFIYDHLTYDCLEQLGWHVVEIPWNQAHVDWGRFDAVVIRSTWDYQETPEHFLEVLSSIENSGTQLLNPLTICRWNLDKHYLRELERRGITIVPTQWLARLGEAELLDVFAEFDHCDIVVKPTIGANADDTFALRRSAPEEWQEAIDTFSNCNLMAQPFIQSIVDEGEFSLFYFGGQFSHAILKTPKQNDFRVQEEHGGSIKATTISSVFAEAGQNVIDSIPESLLYARVDLVRLPNGQPALMELELIEPSLYFGFDEQSPARFASALDSLARTP